MATERLRYRAEMDTKNFEKGSKVLDSTLRKTQGGVRRQSQAFTQLSYALDDAQYGFRGVQNNIQQIAVTAGLSGPLILGLTALLVVMGRVIENFESANKQFIAAKKNFEELTKVILSSDEQIIRDGDTIQEQNRKNLKHLKAQLASNKTLLRTRKDGTASFRELSEAEKESLQESITALETTIDKNATLIDQAKSRIKYKKDLDKVKDSEDIKIGVSKDIDVENPFSKDNIYDLFDINPNDPIIIPVDDILVLDEGDLDIFGALEDEIPAFKEKANELGQALQSSLTDAFSGIGQAIGEALVGDGDIGSKFLKLLGSFMQQFGAALIATGVAELALASGNPALMIAGGVALIAAGAAISAAQSKKPSLSGRTAGGSSRPSVTPTSIQGSVGSGSRTTVIRGQQVRYLNQAAMDSYSARN